MCAAPFRFWGLVALLLALSCAGAPPPRPASRGENSAAAPTDPTVDSGPFRVVFAGADDAQLTLAFSRPVLSAGGAPVVVRAHAGQALDGYFQWFGERIVVFKPSDGFALATSYEATFTPGLRSLDGAPLGDVALFRFTTSVPQVVHASYSYDAANDEQPRVNVELDRSVSAQWLRARMRIEATRASGVEAVPAEIVLPKEADAASYETTSFEVSLHRQAIGFEHLALVVTPELGAQTEARITLKEAGPLLASIRCTPPGKEEEQDAQELCSLENSAIWLALSKPVREDVLAKHLFGPPRQTEPGALGDSSLDSFELGQRFQLEPGKTYRVRLTAGIKTADGEATKRDQLLTFTTADLPASLQFRHLEPMSNVVEAARKEIGLGVDTTNVSAFELTQVPLSETQLLEFLAAPASAAKVSALPNAISRRFAVPTRKNSSVLTRFNLSETLRRPFGKGIFALAATAPNLEEQVRLLSVSDLALTTQWSPHGGLVWVTRLSSARPVANASVALFQGKLRIFNAPTNAQGIVVLPEAIATARGDSHEPVTLIVHSEDDIAYSELTRLESRNESALGVVFSDRRLYRPGESVFVKGYLREPSGRGLLTPKGQAVELTLRDDQGANLTTHAVHTDEFGAFTSDFVLPRGMRLGTGTIIAKLSSAVEVARRPRFGVHTARSRFDHGHEIACWFRISEYRVVDMKIALTADRSRLVRGQSVELKSDAEYLFGSKLHDVPLSIEMTRSRSSFTPPGLEQFNVDERALWQNHAEPTPSEQAPNPVEVVRTQVGPNGITLSSVHLALPGQTSPETVTFDVSVSDATRAFVATDSVSVLVHPAALYLGLRIPHSDSLVPGNAIRPEALVVMPDGTPREGVPVRLELRHFEGDELKRTGPTCSLDSRSQPTACALTLPTSGTFYVRATASDAQGNPFSSASSVIVEEVHERRTKPLSVTRPAPESVHEVVVDTRERAFAERCLAKRDQDEPLLFEREPSSLYVEGEMLWLCARGPTPLLVTLEREGVLQHDLIEHPGTAMLKFPVTPNLHPNFVVSLNGATPRTAPFAAPQSEAPDRGSPAHFTAENDVRVALPARRRLTVELKTQASQAPGSDAEVRLRVHDADGLPVRAQVTLWAVDEGAFLLRPFAVPNPNDRFADERASDVETFASERQLYTGLSPRHVVRPPKVRMGATYVGNSAPLTRALFKSTAWFLPNVVTDADGSARVKARLPDNLTTWKLFAVAASAGNAFGSGEASFKTQRPLVAHPVLPRFLRAGDRFEATLPIDSLLTQPVDLDVSLASEGVLSGSGRDKVHVTAKGNALLHFPISAHAAGKGTLSFHVEGPRALSDSIEQTLQVDAPTLLESVVWSGSGQLHSERTLGDLSALREDAGQLKYHIARSPLVGLAQGFEALLDYPYGCSEQLASRLLPLLRLEPLARSVGVTLPSDIDAHIRSGLTSLLSHQRADGGFGFWPGSGSSDAWLTAWVLFALESASEHGFAVPLAARQQAIDYLTARPSANAPERTVDLSERAVVESVLALVGRPREAELRKLAAERTVSRFARALVAYSLAKIDTRLATELTDALIAEADVSGASALLHANIQRNGWATESDTETTAATLRAVLATKPDHPLVAKLVHGLLSLRRSGTWGNTQATAWALFALDDARRKLPSLSDTSPLSLSLAGKTLGVSRGATLSGTIPIAQLLGGKGPLDFAVEQGSVYYEATLQFARRAPKKGASEHGIYVHRQFTAMGPDGKPRPSGEIHVGDHVRVDALLMSPTRHAQVVLDDPIPAGFDALTEDDDSVQNVSHRELRDDRVLSFFDELGDGVTHVRYLLRAVSAGEFSVPPAKAECMYQQDVYGFTAPEVVRVLH